MVNAVCRNVFRVRNLFIAIRDLMLDLRLRGSGFVLSFIKVRRYLSVIHKHRVPEIETLKHYLACRERDSSSVWHYRLFSAFRDHGT